MNVQTWRTWFGIELSGSSKLRSELRIGIPRTLNIWSTHQFWIAFFSALGVQSSHIVFSSATSEEQGRNFGRGRGTVDCCYPVKCMSGHYGELVFGQKRKIDILFSPLIRSLPSFLSGHVVDQLSCPRVMAGPENIKAGFIREKDAFAEQSIHYVAPLICLAEPMLVPKQLHDSLVEVIPGLTYRETRSAVDAGFAALEAFNNAARALSRNILMHCAQKQKPCILVLARPYHMDSGIGHEIEVDLQACGYPVLWAQYLPTDDNIMDWLFGEDIRSGEISSPFDISDVWPSSYSSNTNEIIWGAKVGSRIPWVACVIRIASYECGMDQPTFTPVQQIVGSSDTLFFSFQDLDATKPAGSIKIRTETISHYLGQHGNRIIKKKLARLEKPGPFNV